MAFYPRPASSSPFGQPAIPIGATFAKVHDNPSDACPAFTEPAVPFRDSPSNTSLINVAVDWYETETAHVFKADIPPGMSNGVIKVGVEEGIEGRVLQISGERKAEDMAVARWNKSERKFGKFLRRFTLPQSAKVKNVTATLEDGVLTVTVGKKKSAVKFTEVEVVKGLSNGISVLHI